MVKGPHLLANRYEIRELIGRGGMAEVHLGFDLRLSRQVAIKMLRVELARDNIFQTRFRREAQSAASLNHPTIVAVYDTGEETVVTSDGKSVDVPYIVMEYVDGNTVKDLLSDGQPVPIDEACEIVIGVLNALEYSHNAGLVHRDIKPGNVMLTRDGKIKVMDFGIARAMTDSQITMTQTDAVVGTAQYLSPEQAKGETVDARSDLYSTGCLLFELLTGRPPFKGDTAVSVAFQHVSQAPPVPSSISSDIPKALDNVVLKALTKDRNHRYSSAPQMRSDLLAVMAGRMVSPPVGMGGDTTQLMGATDPEATSVMSATTDMTPNWAKLNSNADSTQFQPVANADEFDQKNKSSKRMKIVWAVIIALIAILGAATGYILLSSPSASQVSDNRVVVPRNLEGLSKDQVAEALKAAGLIMKVGQPIPSDTIPKGTFVSSTPKSGTKVARNSIVTVHFSSGRQESVMPDVSNMTQAEAIDRLQKLGLELENVVTKDDGRFEEGKVIGTNPPAGSQVRKGDKFQLFVSSGRIEVPGDLVGKSKDDAVRILSQYGLSVEISNVATKDQAPNTVLSVSPTGVVNRGSVIRLVVAADPGPSANQGNDNSGNNGSSGNGSGSTSQQGDTGSNNG